MQERAEVGKAVVQQEQATSWAQLLRHVTVVRRILRIGLELPAATGELVCASWPPLHHHKLIKGQLAQTASDQMSI